MDLYILAEGVGFEPTEGRPSMVFKTTAFNRSATPPQKWGITVSSLKNLLFDDRLAES